MSDAATKAYRERMERVLDYIQEHTDSCPSVEELSRIAHFSKYHFHRQFSEYTGTTVFKYVQFIRLKRAAYQLAFRSSVRIIDIALSAGFESAEAFSRAFRKYFEQSPSQFRRVPQWQPWHDKYRVLNSERVFRMRSGKHDKQVKVVDFRETKVAVLEHRGPPEGLSESVRRFIQWRKENKISPRESATYNIVYDDQATTEPEKYRFDICGSIVNDVPDNPYGVTTKVIPAGRCAVLRHIGSDENIDESFSYLYGEWLPASGEELRDFPVVFHRVNLFPDVAEHEMITDIYLPLL